MSLKSSKNGTSVASSNADGCASAEADEGIDPSFPKLFEIAPTFGGSTFRSFDCRLFDTIPKLLLLLIRLLALESVPSFGDSVPR